MTIWQLLAVVTSPSCDMAIGSAVGTVTRMAVAEGSPPSVPSEVELRLTGVEPEPPELSISAANAETEAEAERQDECDELGGMLFHRFFSFRLSACKIY